MSDGLWVLRPWSQLKIGDTVFHNHAARKVTSPPVAAGAHCKLVVTLPSSGGLTVQALLTDEVPVRVDLQCEGMMTGKGDVLIVRLSPNVNAAERAHLRKACDHLGIRYLLLPHGYASGIMRAGDAPR